MLSPIVISSIIVIVALILGAIIAGIYMVTFKNKPENAGKSFDPAIVVMIMILALLSGLLIVSVYYLVTGKECPECDWGVRDAQALRQAESTFDTLQQKADRIPRDLSYSASCDADPSGGACGIKTRPTPSRKSNLV